MHGVHKPINSLYLRDKKCFAGAPPNQEDSRATGSSEQSAGNPAKPSTARRAVLEFTYPPSDESRN